MAAHFKRRAFNAWRRVWDLVVDVSCLRRDLEAFILIIDLLYTAVACQANVLDLGVEKVHIFVQEHGCSHTLRSAGVVPYLQRSTL